MGTKRRAPPEQIGRGLAERVLFAVLAGPRPQQGVSFAALVVEQLRIERPTSSAIDHRVEDDPVDNETVGR